MCLHFSDTTFHTDMHSLLAHFLFFWHSCLMIRLLPFYRLFIITRQKTDYFSTLNNKVQRYIHWKTLAGRQERCFRMFPFPRHMPLPKILRGVEVHTLTFYPHLSLLWQQFPKWLLLHFTVKKSSEREAMKGKVIPFAALASPATILEWEERKMDKEWENTEQELKNCCYKQETFIASSGPLQTSNHKKHYNSTMPAVNFFSVLVVINECLT